MKYLVEIKADHPVDLGAGAKEAIVSRLEEVLAEDGFDNIDTTLNGQGGDLTEGTIYRMSMGKVWLGPNGLGISSTKDDPAEVRVGAPIGQNIVAQYSGDIVRSDGRHIQIGQIQFCLDERRGRSLSEATGCIRFLLRDPQRSSNEDQQMVCVLTLAVDGPWLPMGAHAGTPW